MRFKNWSMKKRIIAVIMLIIGTQSCALFNNGNGELVGVGDGAYSSSEKEILKRIPKEAKHYFKGMVFIPSMSQHIQNYCNINLIVKDTTIVRFRYNPSSFISSTLSVSAFYISDYEVTNGEYREFVNWVVNYKARELLAQKYPEEYLVAGTKLLKKNQPIRMEQIVNDSLFYPMLDLNPNSLPQNTSIFTYTKTNLLVYKYKYYIIRTVDGHRFMEEKTKSTPIYPNTNCWHEESPNLEGSSSMSSYYFTHPAYSNYPVVGVSYEQALAYCDWRTNRLNEAILQKEKVDIGKTYFKTNDFIEQDTLNEYANLLLPPFELPSVEEWQLAAGSNYINPDFAFKDKSLLDQEGEYLANFGRIVDENNYLVKDYFEKEPNESVYTSAVRSFPSNEYQLYDINGNVAEWTSSNLVLFEGYNKYNPYPLVQNDTTISYKIVKGGSWADGPVYLRWRTNTYYEKTKSSSRIGFRVAMPVLYKIQDVELY